MNHKLKYTYEKGVKLLSSLDSVRYSKQFNDFDIRFCEGRELDESRLQTIKTGFSWGGYDQYGWIVLNVDLPESFRDELVAGFFDFGRTGMGNNSGFESLCILNGEKYQGVDKNHREVLLPGGLLSFEMKFMLWAGLDGGGNEMDISLTHQIKKCQFSILDKKVDDFHYLLKALLQTLNQMDHNSTLYQSLMDLLNQAYNMISLNNPEKMTQQIYEANRMLEENLLELREENPDVVRCLGHTHIDVAWLWTLEHTREKAQRSFATVLQLMERYPNYIFFQSQPQIYSKLKQDAPEIFEKIKDKVAEGVWEPNGGMWVEADCLLTGGESLVRQLLYGKSFFNEEFGVESNVLWLPDVFGYSAALPQILKLADIDSFMTTKISWNQYNRIPNDTFKWRGIDGSEVITHFVTTPTMGDAGELESLDFYTYNGMINANSVNGIWESYSNKGLTDELLLSYGYGDGGGGVTREMLEMVDKLDKIPGNPRLITGNAGEYFDKLQDLKDNKDLNTWDGELYLEFHRGTYTSQARTKRFNRKLEYALRNNEILAIMNGVDTYPQEFFETQWKEVLTRQFHDILPGSSINEVYEEAEKTYAEITGLLKKNSEDTVREMAGSDEGYSLFNPNSFSTRETLFIAVDASGVFSDESGVEIKNQTSLNNDGYYLSVDLEPLSFKHVHFSQSPDELKKRHDSESLSDLFEIENQYYKIKWNKAGKISSLIHKSEGRELVPEGKFYNDLKAFEDKPRYFDAWELEPYYQEKSESIDNLISSRLIEDGPVLKIVEFIWKLNSSVITQNMKLYTDSRRIDFETVVDWKERNTILRTFFETDIRSTRASYDVQFGNIERTTHNNTIWDFAKFEVPAQKWADLSQRGRGLALMNDCKYGYSIKDSTLGMSLLKSAEAPDRVADWGKHEFCYSILPHDGDIYASAVEKESLILNNPVRLFDGCVDNTDTLISIDHENILIDAVKLSEDGKAVIIRMHEYAGMDCDSIVKSSLEFKSWRIVNLLERNVSEVSTAEINLSFKPFEIKSLALDLN
ncbi:MULTISPECIES: glycoside hydrolase family 38 C-terminal domain-containing protein [unclassified Oceanispirochaeta]|uniref:alpha-mannosidase n=1 Tax=unclassified Oceanispirochaeta TaxID=2635722 RepID=UPI000E091A93|nr:MULTISPECIES: glycoside hydrolase family 38 C-terminal domain-containing protein [unclassified Oceanispirochaeta]MBF9015857.1 alpha-mannosidase [Oceanispirochaeta sp. M2]NPD72320.1 alpha-mannosidase [Oceanispirochaeta sp. M1]RDG32090.1 alpha-mannosidase [Oceanispirochaeta sp. M1]